jgi:hypothetical protein
VVRLLAALGKCVSGRRGAERSERSEDGTPAARDPSEARGTPSGPYQFPDKRILLMILNILEVKDLPVYGEGKNVLDWLYVEDHASAS